MSQLDIFKNKKILITCHTGFKGSWLALWLNNLRGKILGVSLKPQTTPSNYIAAFNYEGITIPSVIAFKNIFGCQFHPEKSGKNGLQVSNFFCNLLI